MKLSKVNTDKVEHGAWVGDIPDMGDLRLKVRGINNARFRRMQQELIAAVPRSNRRKGRIDPIEMDKITAACLHATVLEDWDNLDTDDSPGPGKEGRQLIPYTKEQAHAYLTDPAYRPFYEATVYAATIVGDDDAEADKDDEGNSARPLPGA